MVTETRSLAPSLGRIDTEMHAMNPGDFLKTLSPIGTISSVEDILDAASNVLSLAQKDLGSLDKVTKLVKLAVFLAIEGDFFSQPKETDAALELLRDVFGVDELSVRVVFGVASLS